MTTFTACAALAIIELDVVLIAQVLVSRPLIAGSILGALIGKAQAGAFFGAVFELLSLRDLPVGGCLAWSATVAAGTATILAGNGTSFPLCFFIGIVIGILHCRIEAFERGCRASTGDNLVKGAEIGDRTLGLAMGASIARHALMTFALVSAGVAFGGFVDRRWWMSEVEVLRSGAEFIFLSAPWIGLAGVAVWALRRS